MEDDDLELHRADTPSVEPGSVFVRCARCGGPAVWFVVGQTHPEREPEEQVVCEACAKAAPPG